MTTFAELKTQLKTIVADPDGLTFDDASLGYFINAGIAEVSRIAPQRFVEDISLIDGQMAYRLRGGTGNLVSNPSFEDGDETVLADYTAVDDTTAPDLTAGWSAVDALSVKFATSAFRRTGTRVCSIQVLAAGTTDVLYQDIPVNPDTTYVVSGWHWKGTAGGESNTIEVDTLNAASALVTADVIAHSTTSATPVFMSGSYTIPASGVSFLRIKLVAEAAGAAGSTQTYGFEDILVAESTDVNLLSSNAEDDVEIRRVELWSSNYDPHRRVASIARGRDNSEAGYDYWDGELRIPYRMVSAIDPSLHFLKVWGYAPYDKLTTDAQVTDLSFELEQAVMSYAQTQALARLVFERDLFTQWQTRTGNTDVSPAALMNSLTLAREDWRRKSRALMVIREGV